MPKLGQKDVVNLQNGSLSALATILQTTGVFSVIEGKTWEGLAIIAAGVIVRVVYEYFKK